MVKQDRPLEDLIIRPMGPYDIAGAQKVGVETWSELASRELGYKVKYPTRPRRIIEAYMWKEPEGCLVAEHRGKIVGTAYSHVWGGVGWLGPFEVLPEMQDRGVGTALLAGCEAFLDRRGCRVQGLETMSNNVKNIHFYLRGGYRAIGSSLIMEKGLTSEVEEAPRLEPSPIHEVASSLDGISRLSRKGHPLLDYSKEVEMASKYDLGPCFLSKGSSGLKGFAILHSFYPSEEADHGSLRLLLVDPRSRAQEKVFALLLASCEAWAFQHGRKRLFVRFPADNSGLYQDFLRNGYKLDAANLRLAIGDQFSERGKYHLAAWAG
jgi:GNAT superfamily N-acetyltransferase